jgi:sugar phosphate permease
MSTFLVFLLGYTLSQFFRTFLAVIAPELGRKLGIGPYELGVMSAVYFVAFALAQLPVGHAFDRIGPRRIVPLTLLVAAAGCAVFALAQGFAALVLALALIGIGCSAVYMGALYMFGRVYAAHRFAFLSSWLIGLGSAGNLLASTPLAAASETIGWRAAFLAIGAITLVAALLIYMVVRDPPGIERAVPEATILSGLREVISIKAIWPILPLVATSYAVVAAERALWVGPYFAEVQGLGPIDRGNAVLCIAAAMSAGALLYGPLDQWLGTRKWIVAAGGTLTVVGFLLLWRYPQPSLLASIVLLSALGAVAHNYGVLMAHGRQFFPDRLLGRGITFLNFLFIGGTGVVQYASGQYVAWLKTAGTSPADTYAALHLALGLLLAGSLAVYLVAAEKPVAALKRPEPVQ